MLKHKSMKQNRQKGFTAIELLFALGIIAVATVVIVKSMSSNSDKAKAQQMIQDVSALVDNIKGAYSSSSDGFTQLTNATVISGKLYPSDLTATTTDITNQFSGGTITIADVDANSFTIAYNKVPTEVCTEVVTKLANDTFSKIETNSTQVFPGTSTKVDPTAIAAGCAGDPSVTFTVTN